MGLCSFLVTVGMRLLDISQDSVSYLVDNILLNHLRHTKVHIWRIVEIMEATCDGVWIPWMLMLPLVCCYHWYAQIQEYWAAICGLQCQLILISDHLVAFKEHWLQYWYLSLWQVSWFSSFMLYVFINLWLHKK